MEKKHSQFLLNKTKEDYNLIAQDYARTRSFVSEDIKSLAELVSPGEKVLDSGCANGRLFEVLKKKRVDYFGIDISEKLVEIARKNYPQGNFQKKNSLALSFSDDFFDKVFSISVLHNIPSRELRIIYLKEAKRVLKPGGYLILRVWDLWKQKGIQKTLFKYFFLKLIGKSKLDFFDLFFPWKNSKGEIIAQRYFHCFAEKELEKLVRLSGFKIKRVWREGFEPRANIYIVAEK